MEESLFDKLLTKIIRGINNNYATVNISFREAKINKDGVYTLIIDGGENGGAGNKCKWGTYLNALQVLCSKLEERYNKVWIHTFNIDSIDDVWTVYIGIEQ